MLGQPGSLPGQGVSRLRGGDRSRSQSRQRDAADQDADSESRPVSHAGIEREDGVSPMKQKLLTRSAGILVRSKGLSANRQRTWPPLSFASRYGQEWPRSAKTMR